MPILKDGKRLAQLKWSVGRNHAEPRPLNPIQVAQYLQEMKDDLKDTSNSKVAKMLDISTILVSNFLSLLDAPTKYQYLWGWGKAKDGRLPWSMCRRLGIEYKNGLINEEEFGKLINIALNNDIAPTALEDVLQIKKRNPNKSFDACCKEILNLVPETITTIIFIADLDDSVIEQLQNKATSSSIDDIAEKILKKYFGDELEGVLIKNNKHIKIALTEDGRKKLDDIANKNKKSIFEIINHIFSKEIL